ncbi:AaceriADL286Wp [[Ashbya] aceris (nom. inval.)]|nr:AaceriADL286Wp [[Ashbya] aceris (nom. inval.)]
MNSVEDLLQLQSKIDALEKERDDIAKQMQEVARTEGEVVNDFEALNSKLAGIAEEISAARTLEDVYQLREKYGELAILDEAETLLREQEAAQRRAQNARTLAAVAERLGRAAELDYQDLVAIHAELRPLVGSAESAAQVEQFNELVTERARLPRRELEHELLERRCDTELFVPSEESVRELREKSSLLFQLSQLLLPEPREDQLWNFVCMANNFRIKFIYHFTNPSAESEQQSIENYFKFLDKYLSENLYKYMDMFEDEERGITRALIHEQFINHILEPVREKVKVTMTKIAASNSASDVKMLVLLISEIFITDNALKKSHYYDGVGLVSLIDDEALDIWQNFEVESAVSQFEKLTTPGASLMSPKNGADFGKLLENMYRYLEPFFSIDYRNLFSVKYKLVDEIFIQLPLKYRSFLLSKNVLQNELNAEQQFENTCVKLHSLLLISHILVRFSHDFTFIEMTQQINKITDSDYEYIFDEVWESYDEAVVVLRDSIVHRWVKGLSSSLRNYFKYNEWDSIATAPEQCSAELVGALAWMKKMTEIFDKYWYPQHIIAQIKVALLENIIKFMLNYVVKLNKFSENGLRQLTFDYEALRATLGLPLEHSSIAEELALFEYFNILSMKYTNNASTSKFLDAAYVSSHHTRDFTELRNSLQIRHLTSDEIADALYRTL